jgi:hypothetical protein
MGTQTNHSMANNRELSTKGFDTEMALARSTDYVRMH